MPLPTTVPFIINSSQKWRFGSQPSLVHYHCYAVKTTSTIVPATVVTTELTPLTLTTVYAGIVTGVTLKLFACCLAGPILTDWRPDHCRRHHHHDHRCLLYPPVPFPTPIGRQLLSSLPEPVSFRAEFRAVATADHPDSFVVPPSIDPDHQPALGRRR